MAKKKDVVTKAVVKRNEPYRNINKRKKAGTSSSKKKSTISAKAYANMKAGFERRKRKSDTGGHYGPFLYGLTRTRTTYQG